MADMFYGAAAFDQDLGWCVDDDVDLRLVRGVDSRPCRVGRRRRRRHTCFHRRRLVHLVPDKLTSSTTHATFDKMMTLVVLRDGLLGLSLAIAAGLFALRQQQAAKKPRAPRTFTVLPSSSTSFCLA